MVGRELIQERNINTEETVEFGVSCRNFSAGTIQANVSKFVGRKLLHINTICHIICFTGKVDCDHMCDFAS